MSDRFVLDACALIAYFNDETGADKAEHLISRALREEVVLYAASINVYEVYYDALRRGSPGKAEELLSDIYAMPLTIVEEVDRPLMRHAGFFKTAHKISRADSIALALSKQLDAQLVTTDHHEFDDVERSGEVRFFWLR